MNPSSTSTIASSAIGHTQALLAAPAPMPPLPDPEELRALAMASEEPRSETKQVAGCRYDRETAPHKIEVEAARKLHRRHLARLDEQEARAQHALREAARLEVDYGERRRIPPLELANLAFYGVVLISLVTASVATVSAVVMDTGIVASWAQAVAFALVPSLGAMLVAMIVSGLATQSAYQRYKKILNRVTILLVVAWPLLFVAVFGGGATVGIDVLVDDMMTGGEELLAQESPLLGQVFFALAIFLEMVGGALVKLRLEEILARSRRSIPVRGAFYTEVEQELQRISAERAEVEAADAALAGRIDEIDAGRRPYIDSVLALLLRPSTTSQTQAVRIPHTDFLTRSIVGPSVPSSSNGSAS